MKKVLLCLSLLSLTLISCTDNSRARSWGGKEVIELPSNHRFINSTWKETNLWVITQDTISGKFYMNEKSSFGVLEGSIEFK